MMKPLGWTVDEETAGFNSVKTAAGRFFVRAPAAIA